eukprot:gb/GEZJ01006827.1/.p1 GENE.gb/GEZJ01006827.1/~~gb/GEZJ01006827.1/.p1  ORF type:complete len:342 (+),score=39.81 gb/GEZJ01006827.1/:506-1531(+)
MDPYHLYELRRPQDRATSVVPQLPHQPEYARTRLRYRRITSMCPPNSRSPMPPTSFPAAFHPPRANSFDSSDLSSISFKSKSWNFQAVPTATPVLEKGSLLRYIRNVNRVYPFRRSFRKAAEMDMVKKLSVHGPAESEFEVCSDEQDHAVLDCEGRRRNSLTFPASKMHENDSLVRTNTAPLFVRQVRAREEAFCLSSSSSCRKRQFVHMEKMDTPDRQSCLPHPPTPSLCRAARFRRERASRSQSACHLDNDSGLRHRTNFGGENEAVPSVSPQASPSFHQNLDSHETNSDNLPSFNETSVELTDHGLPYVLLQRTKKISRKILGKMSNVFHSTRMRDAC